MCCRARSCRQRCCRPPLPAACMISPSHMPTAMSLPLVGWARFASGTCTAGVSCCACLCPTWTAAASPSCRSAPCFPPRASSLLPNSSAGHRHAEQIHVPALHGTLHHVACSYGRCHESCTHIYMPCPLWSTSGATIRQGIRRMPVGCSRLIYFAVFISHAICCP